MSDYIERVELIRFLDEMAANASILREVEWTEVLKEMSAHIKTADVVEVKHGRWLKHITDELHEVWRDKCSVCGFELDDLITAEGYNYCPNCGARMDGE